MEQKAHNSLCDLILSKQFPVRRIQGPQEKIHRGLGSRDKLGALIHMIPAEQFLAPSWGQLA